MNSRKRKRTARAFAGVLALLFLLLLHMPLALAAASLSPAFGEEDALIVADDGTIIRTGVAGVSVLGRATQGVRIMRPNEGAKVISAALTEPENAEELEDGDEKSVENVDNSVQTAQED